MRYGREESEWNELVQATTEFLADQARLRRYTTYTELNAVLHRRTGAHPFDFAKDGDRAAMGALLGEVARTQLPTVGLWFPPSCSTSTRTTPAAASTASPPT